MQSHGKSFLFGLVGTVQGRLGWAHGEAVNLGREIEAVISEAKWLALAPFDTIHYVLRFGAKSDAAIHCRHVKKRQEVEVASQLSMAELHEVLLNRPQIRAIICRELERVFLWIQQRYSLPDIPQLFSRLQQGRGA